MREKRVVKTVEPFLLTIPLLIGLVLSIPGLFWKSYNPSAGFLVSWCTWVENEIRNDSKPLVNINTFITFGIATLLFVIIMSFAAIIARSIHTERYIRRSTRQSIHSRHTEIQNLALKRLTESNKNTRVIIIQSLLYLSAFLMTLTMPLIHVSVNQPLWASRAQLILLPLQGFFNMLIFIGHKIYNYRRIHPDVSRRDVLLKLFTGKADDHVLFSRISQICIAADGGKMEVEITDERDDVDHVDIEVTSQSHRGMNVKGSPTSGRNVNCDSKKEVEGENDEENISVDSRDLSGFSSQGLSGLSSTGYQSKNSNVQQIVNNEDGSRLSCISFDTKIDIKKEKSFAHVVGAGLQKKDKKQDSIDNHDVVDDNHENWQAQSANNHEDNFSRFSVSTISMNQVKSHDSSFERCFSNSHVISNKRWWKAHKFDKGDI